MATSKLEILVVGSPTGTVSISSDQNFRTAGGVGEFTTGNFVVALGGANNPNNGFLDQEFITTADANYTLNFDYGAFSVYVGAQSIEITVEDVSSGQTLLRETILDSSTTNDLQQVFDSYVFQFKATGTMTRLTFADSSTATFAIDGIVDNVRVSLLGDVNQDGGVDFADIPAFIEILIGGAFLAEADINQDSAVDFADIPGFIEILIAR